ncbi:Cytochrome c mitochondrial import factor CYC2 [Spathaspora sp. JA1]|nr:Cytochrome c mitochondrial import factor CYC2 [Spathaspora sp. JA1]
MFKRILRQSVRFNSSKHPELPKKNQLTKPGSIPGSKSAPAPIDDNISSLLSKSNKPYLPKLSHNRVSYEYPNLPNQDDFITKKPKVVTTRWTRYIPKIIAVLAIAWGGYVVKIYFYDDVAEPLEILSPDEFHKFRVLHKEIIDENHMIIEIQPCTTAWQASYKAHYEEKSIWNGSKGVWSVDIKQPEINIVRRYTPLPLYYMKSELTRSGEKEPLLRVINPDIDEYDQQGTMCIYIKRYNDGEVSKYITNKQIGDVLELRGPYQEYKFPMHPLNKYYTRPIFKDIPSKVEPENFRQSILKQTGLSDLDSVEYYGGGTGITPILQVLLSRNPYLGFINVNYSARTETELGEGLSRFLFFLDKLDRIKLRFYVDTINPISLKNIPTPEAPTYLTPKALENHPMKEMLQQPPEQTKELIKKIKSEKDRGLRFDTALDQAQATKLQPKKNASFSLVCGPDGFIEYMAGAKKLDVGEQGEVKGLLGKKGWNSANVYKL